MPDNYIGEIRLFSYSRVPVGWHACDGSILSIQQNQALYSLIGSRFGGDGRTTFALPDMRGRVGVASGRAPSGSNYALGNQGGAETVTLNTGHLPVHTHQMQSMDLSASTAAPRNAMLANIVGDSATNVYVRNQAPSLPIVQLAAASVAAVGGAAHPNRQPSLVLNYCIAITGLYPSQP